MNVPLIVIGAILLFFLFLLLLPVKVLIVYKSEVTLTLRVLGIPIRLYPRKKKVKWRNYSPKKAARIAARKEKKEAKKAPQRATFFDEVELSLNNSLGRKAKVITKDGKEGGTLEIAFFDKDDLARIANILAALE